MTLEQEFQLKNGQRLVHISSKLSGYLQNIDNDEYNIIDSGGRVIESIIITVHTDVKAPSQKTRSVQRTAK